MHTYELFGVSVASEFALPELPDCVAAPPVIALCLRNDIPGPDRDEREIVRGEAWQASATPTGYVVRFDGHATFLIDRGAGRIDCNFPPSATPDSVRHLLLDHVFPLALNLRGFTVMHASAVADATGACAFVAESGGGKSTLAGSFTNGGWTLLADDAVLLEAAGDRVYGRFSYAGLRLWPDSLDRVLSHARCDATKMSGLGKLRVAIGSQPAISRALLDCLYVLEAVEAADDRSIHVEPVTPRDATLELIRSAFRLDVTDGAMLVKEFRFLSDVAARVPVRRLIYPREFDLLPRVREIVMRDLRGLRGVY